MTRYDVYNKKENRIEFLVAIREDGKAAVKIFEQDDSHPVCETLIYWNEHFNNHTCRIMKMDEGHDDLREVMLEHKYPGDYQSHSDYCFEFILLEAGMECRGEPKNV